MSNVQNISLTLEEKLLAQIDERAEALDLNRSQYFRRLARADLAGLDTADKQPKQKTQRLAAA